MKPRQQSARLMRESAVQMPRLIQTRGRGGLVGGWVGEGEGGGGRMGGGEER